MTTVGGGEGTPTWFHQNERANALPDSKGDKKLRFDLIEMLGIETKDKTTIDLANQFLVAGASEDVVTDKDANRTAKLPGRVAVKVGEEKTKEGKVYKYAFINLYSLSKRLHLNKADIKQAEANGTLHTLIATKIKTLSQDQNKFSEMLTTIASGKAGETFLKSPPERPGTVAPKIRFEEGPDKPQKVKAGGKITGIEKGEARPALDERRGGELEEGVDRTFLSNFIKEHFSEDVYLMKNLEEFLDQSDNSKDSMPYLKNLVPKLWWSNPRLEEATGVRHEKVSVENLNPEIFKDKGLSVFVGKAASRPDNEGKESTTRLRMNGDATGRYSFIIDTFVYSSEPKPQGNLVPVEIREDLWVLANKNSLNRLGITPKEIKEGVKNHDLGRIMDEKMQSLRSASNEIAELSQRIGKEGVKKNDIELIRKYEEHPDESVRDITKQFIKDYEKWSTKGDGSKLSSRNREKAAINEVEKFLDNLKDARLLLSPMTRISADDVQKDIQSLKEEMKAHPREFLKEIKRLEEMDRKARTEKGKEVEVNKFVNFLDEMLNSKDPKLTKGNLAGKLEEIRQGYYDLEAEQRVKDIEVGMKEGTRGEIREFLEGTPEFKEVGEKEVRRGRRSSISDVRKTTKKKEGEELLSSDRRQRREKSLSPTDMRQQTELKRTFAVRGEKGGQPKKVEKEEEYVQHNLEDVDIDEILTMPGDTGEKIESPPKPLEDTEKKKTDLGGPPPSDIPPPEKKEGQV